MRGAEEIAEMMQGYRENPPAAIAGTPVIQLLDYQIQVGKNLQSGNVWDIELPKSNVLQFILEDGSKISARPSGTEPKIKFYFSVKTRLESVDKFEETQKKMDDRIQAIISDLKLK
ncbi:MAG: hypothetical protein WKG06_03740 [Segetibacter sp.]